jgi:hypothetical protein
MFAMFLRLISLNWLIAILIGCSVTQPKKIYFGYVELEPVNVERRTGRVIKGIYCGIDAFIGLPQPDGTEAMSKMFFNEPNAIGVKDLIFTGYTGPDNKGDRCIKVEGISVYKNN